MCLPSKWLEIVKYTFNNLPVKSFFFIQKRPRQHRRLILFLVQTWVIFPTIHPALNFGFAPRRGEFRPNVREVSSAFVGRRCLGTDLDIMHID